MGSDTELHSNLVERKDLGDKEDKRDKGDKGEKILCLLAWRVGGRSVAFQPTFRTLNNLLQELISAVAEGS